MKMPQEWYDRIKTGTTQIVDFLGPKKIKDGYAHLTTDRLCWDLYRILMRNWGYDDTHPFFANGSWPRIVPYCNVNYDTLYALNLYDSHILTAMKRIVKELGLKD